MSLLEPAAGATPPAGTRVRVLGLSGEAAVQEERFGRILGVTPERFEIELDRPAVSKGWAGAPVLLADGDTLLGTLEPDAFRAGHGCASASRRSSFLLRALARPLEHGAGRPFARFAAPALPMAPPGAKLIQPSEPQTTHVQLDVSLPVDASRVPPAACGIFVSGRARALTGELRGFDVAIVIDTSLSTIEPTGADVNGNGIVGSPLPRPA